MQISNNNNDHDHDQEEEDDVEMIILIIRNLHSTMPLSHHPKRKSSQTFNFNSTNWNNSTDARRRGRGRAELGPASCGDKIGRAVLLRPDGADWARKFFKFLPPVHFFLLLNLLHPALAREKSSSNGAEGPPSAGRPEGLPALLNRPSPEQGGGHLDILIQRGGQMASQPPARCRRPGPLHLPH